MVGWHHLLKGQEFEQTVGDGEGPGSLACCSPRGHKGIRKREGGDLKLQGHLFPISLQTL